MLSRDLLNQLVPAAPEARTVGVSRPSFIAEDEILLKLAAWRDAAEDAWLLDIDGLERFLPPFPYYTSAAVGIVPVGQKAREVDGFPVVNGYQFGIVIYSLRPGAARYLDRIPYLPAYEESRRIPVHFQQVDFTAHTHPLGGRSAAVLTDGADEFLLTAGHNVERVPAGSYVMLQPSLPCPTTPVFQKMTGCVDAALLGPVAPHVSISGVALGSPTTVMAAIGQTVDLRLGSTATAQQATVMQSFLPMSRYLTVVQANTFLFDAYGVHGDSGAAIVTAGSDAVGMYLGITAVQDQAGQMHRMGFGIDIDQCVDLFGMTLKGAIL